MKLLIKNGLVNDPINNIDNEVLDILVEDGVIKQVSKGIAESGCDEIIDASDLLVLPGLIDMHVHLREPGQEGKESIKTGSIAAAAGGFTSIVCMANTKPPIDTAGQIKYILMTAMNEAVVNVYPYGAVTQGLKGELITEMGDMLEAGAIAFSDDGCNIERADTMRRALEYLTMYDKPIIIHAEDEYLIGKGSMHESDLSRSLGLHGVPREAEEIVVARDILLARLTGGRIHITHTSSRGSVELIRRAKADGIRITADVTPHHISLTHKEIGDYNTNMKMRPPLREDSDLEALIEGLRDGTIDVVATDHAPHSDFEKSFEFNLAPNGVIGLETAIPVVLDRLIEYKPENYKMLATVMSVNPAKILGLDELGKGSLTVGNTADITIIDANTKYTYTKEMIVSKSKNSPYIGWELKGLAAYTIVGGKIIFKK